MKVHHILAANLLFCSFVLANSRADLITFETGFSEQQHVSSISTATNVVTLASDGGGPFIAQVGDPTVAFGSVYGSDTVRPDLATEVGTFFLSDENTGGTNIPGSITFVFSNPIDNLSMALLDLDGGNFASLTTYSTPTFGGQNGYQSINGTDDGIVDTLSIQTPSSTILSARLTTSDTGLALDNITFVTSIPEPAALLLATFASTVVLVPSRRSSRHY